MVGFSTPHLALAGAHGGTHTEERCTEIDGKNYCPVPSGKYGDCKTVDNVIYCAEVNSQKNEGIHFQPEAGQAAAFAVCLLLIALVAGISAYLVGTDKDPK